MTDPRTKDQLLALFADNDVRAILADMMRDFTESIIPALGAVYVTASVPTEFLNTDDFVRAAAGGVGLGTTSNFGYLPGPTPEDPPNFSYLGATPCKIIALGTGSVFSASNNQLARFRLAKNGLWAADDAVATEIERKIGSGGDIGNAALFYEGYMEQNDHFQLFIRNTTSLADITITKAFFLLIGFMLQGDEHNLP